VAKKAARKSAKGSTSSKTSTTRAAARKTTAKRSANKAAAKKSAARKTSARKPTIKKTAIRKTAARAAATRKRRTRPSPPEPSTLQTAATAAKGLIAGAVTAVTSRLPGRRSQPDALQLLEQEHRRFEALLKQGEDSTERARKGRRELLQTLTTELNEHELMEEKVLYPALQSHPEGKDIVLEGYEEHHVADLIAGELKDVATNDEQWGAKFKVLKENIEHHIQEEEGEMFRLARGIFSRDELQELGDRMRELKRK
jgi:hypothetical protein